MSDVPFGTNIAAASARGSVESSRSAVSWAAIIAGAVTATVIALILAVVGAGIGLISISPWSNSGASATTVGILAILWSLAVPLFAYAVGGYVAGRLRTQWVDVHSDEVFFRDTAHGMLVWALGTLVTACLVGSVLSATLGSVVQTGGKIAGAAISAAGSTAGSAAGGDVNAYFNDMLFRSQQAPAQGDNASSKAEVGRIVARSLASGQLSDDDKNYVAQVVAQQTGLNQADAAKRVDDVVAKAKDAAQQAADKAKAAADTARKAGIYAALWAFVGLLLGGLSASYMATVGGRIRDDLPAL